ncbi:uncharacterized protein EV422DRAFT_564199 [Fimicolochytrium jonesii]|uniref:uncharacterized protein n=1 Tax=Fimicolochytrium jonesii TaxID=1396493 RepID=UPI0022FDF819|nr:uncharacterized protein EV422DRAFT_564199 [Fimicolochytrium jonesii]KAI8824867.1 hypothetical protein EV422DRAFT_564199 [Fimicolochytrium jonesii]
MTTPTPTPANPWTSLESLILVQAVYRHGEDSWTQVSKLLRNHPALSRAPEFFVPKSCERQYHALLAEATEADKRSARDVEDPNAVDQLPIAKAARRLHIQRIDEIKLKLREEEILFREIVQEIDEIKSGKWDAKLREAWEAEQQKTNEGGDSESTAMEVDDAAAAEQGGGDVPMDVDTMPAVVTDAGLPPRLRSASPVKKTLNTRNSNSPIPPPEKRTTLEKLKVPVHTATAVHQQHLSTASPTSEAPSTMSPGGSPVKARGPGRRGSLASAKMKSNSDPDLVDVDSGAENSDGADPTRRRSTTTLTSKNDPTLAIWKKTVYFILAKIADHRYGNVFASPVREEGYQAVVRQPMSLDLVRARVRKGITTTTAEFHRDLLQVFTNAIMYNNEDTEVYSMALEMKEFVDAEVQHLTKYANDPGSRGREASVEGGEGLEGV